MPVFNNILAGASGSAGGAGGFKIERSLRFNSADSAYLDKPFSSAGNRKTFTFSCWVKRSGLTAENNIFHAGNASWFRFENTDQIYIWHNGETSPVYTDAKFRDVSAWYHLVLSVDTTQSTASNRIKLYVNGTQQTLSGTQPDPNADLAWNNNVAHYIGRQQHNAFNMLNGYLADVHFLDGLTPGTNTDDTDGSVTGTPNAEYLTDFGEFDDNGVWQPKEYTHGTAKHLGDWVADTSGTHYNVNTTKDRSFDGDTSTRSQPAAGQTLNFQPSTAITGITKVRVRVDRNSGTADSDLQLNGSNIGGSYSNGNDQSAEFTVTTLTSLSWSATSGGNAFSVRMIEIYYDGAYHTLTIGQVNSFYLKFADNSSNAALGTDSSGNSNTWTVNNISGPGGDADYASMVTQGSDGGYNAGSEAATAFDGSLTTAPNTSASNNNGNITFTPSPSISHTTSVRAYWKWGNSSATYSYNGGSNTSITASGWITLASGSGTFTSLNTYRGGDGQFFSAIEIDGTILITSTGADNDSLIDTPTDYTADSGNNGGNYCTLNPLDRQASNGTLSNGNLDLTSTGAAWAMYRGTMFVSSGKWYWECTLGNNQYSTIGICSDVYQMASASGNWVNGSTEMFGYYPNNGQKYNGGSGISYATGDATATGSVVGVALDMDNGTLTFYKDGTSLGQAFSGLTGKSFSPTHWIYQHAGVGNADSYNFGQRPFAYTPPTGHLSLCTQNFDPPTIADGSTAMDVALWDGDGNATKTVTTSFSPGFVWAKSRTVASNPQLSDVVRGNGKVLFSSTTGAEGDYSTFGGGGISSLGTNQFVISQGSSTNNNLNTNNSTGVAWTWDAGTSTASNTDGSITSSVRANASAGFSIVSTPSIDSTNTIRTAGHGLNATPEFIISKNREFADNWFVYHKDIQTDNKQRLFLNSTSAVDSSSSTIWAHTSSVIGFNGAQYVGSPNTDDLIFYCWAAVEGYSAFGSFVSNNSTNNVFVHTGFLPRWILWKRSSSSGGWFIYDAARNAFNPVSSYLEANSSGAESDASPAPLDLLSNGFKVRNTLGGTGTFIYAAFAEHPFKTARAR